MENRNINKRRKSNKNLQNSKNKFYVSIFIFIFILSLGCFVTYNYYIDNKPDISTSPIVQEIIEEKHNSSTIPDKELSSKYVNNLPNFREQYNNNNILGHLTIPSLNLDTLVAKANNNKFYLNHNLNNNYDILGAQFFDYRHLNNIPENRQINIYGHNSQFQKYHNQLPFVKLEAFVDRNVFKKCRNVYLDTDNGRMKFEVVAVKIINDSDITHMDVSFNNDQEWLDHEKKLFSNCLYRDYSATRVSPYDQLLVLQVCHYNPMGSYLLVICKNVD